MIDSTKLAATIARHREVEAKATKGPVKWDGPVWKSTAENEENGEAPWLIVDGDGPAILQGLIHARTRADAERIPLALNSHAAFIDLWEAAGEVLRDIEAAKLPYIFSKPAQKLNAALARLVEEK